MKEQPILFSGPMVRAILDGRKTQTRRIVKPQKRKDGVQLIPELLQQIGVGHACPHGAVGDRLWVREKWGPCQSNYKQDIATATYACFPDGSQKFKLGTYFQYNNNPDDIASKWPSGWKWRPSIHMPRWASRITLEITGVRVERLNEISEEDAQSEGVPVSLMGASHRIGFENLWGSINGPESWAANPFVWVIEFKRIETT